MKMHSVAYKKQEKNEIRWLLFALGFFFIFNPNITVIDPLPDFIGYIIICAALRKLALISDTLADAKKTFEKMILIDGGKLVAIFWVFGIDAVSERASSLLLWSFVFGTLEAMFLIPSYLKLFKGLSELGDFHNNSSVHLAFGHGKKSHTDMAKMFTVAFIVFKALFTVLPEFSDFSNIASFESGATVSLYRYIGIMRGLSCLCVLIVGIAWYSGIVRYFKRISKDTGFNASINERYRTGVLPRTGIFIIRNARIASWLLVIAAILTLEIKLDGVSLIPDVFMLVALIPAIVYLGRNTKIKKGGIYALSVLYGAVSIIAYLLDVIFQSKYNYNAMDKDFSAFSLYFYGVIAVAVQGIVFIALIWLIIRKIQQVVSEHTGYVLGREIITEGEDGRIAAVHHEINKGFYLALDFAIVYVISDVASSLYGAIYAFMRNNAGYLPTLNFIAGLVFVGMLIRAFDTFNEAVRTKYMLE